MPDHNYFSNLMWQVADLLRGPYRPPQYERVMLPMTVLRRFDCVLAPTKAKVLTEFEKRKGGKLEGDALDTRASSAPGSRQRNRNHRACLQQGRCRARLRRRARFGPQERDS